MKLDFGAAVRLTGAGLNGGEFGAGKARTMANFQMQRGSERSHAATGAAPGSTLMDMSADTGDLSLVRRVQGGGRGPLPLLVVQDQPKIVKLLTPYFVHPAGAGECA